MSRKNRFSTISVRKDFLRDIDRRKIVPFIFIVEGILLVLRKLLQKLRRYVFVDHIEGSVRFEKVISFLVCLTLKNSQTDPTISIVRLLIPMFVNVSKGLL